MFFHQRQKIVCGFEKEIKKSIKKLFENLPVMFSDFRFASILKQTKIGKGSPNVL